MTSLGAILGGIVFGSISEKLGRRRAIPEIHSSNNTTRSLGERVAGVAAIGDELGDRRAEPGVGRSEQRIDHHRQDRGVGGGHRGGERGVEGGVLGREQRPAEGRSGERAEQRPAAFGRLDLPGLVVGAR